MAGGGEETIQLEEVEREALDGMGLRCQRIMGEGAYSRVLRCTRDQGGDDVAVKIINRERASRRFLDRFLPRELAVAARLDHPNIVRTIQSNTIATRTYVIMDLCTEGDLEQHITTQGALKDLGRPDDEVRSAFKQILLGVEHLHGRNIVHRDLKIENIFVSPGWRLKVGDFGFSREMGDEELSETFCGSPAYAAPELLQQKPYKGRRTDLWALGIILFICLEARMPFDERDRARMLRRQLGRRIPFRRSQPQPKDLVKALLHPRPEQRLSLLQTLAHPFFRHPQSTGAMS